MTSRSRVVRAIRPRTELGWLLTGSSRRSDGDLRVWSHLGAVDRTTQRRAAIGSPTDLSGVLSPADEPARVQTQQGQVLPSKVLQAGHNIVVEAGGRRAASGRLG